MRKLTQFLPYILIVVAFFAGMLLKTSPDKELKKKWESERETLQDQIEARDARILILTGVETKIREKAKADSIRSSMAIQSKDARIKDLKKRLDEINTTMASGADLDSIIARLYPD
jgi:hypothetical protein